MTISDKGNRLHQFFLANILLGMAVFVGAVYFMITGEYANLTLRQETESWLNMLSVGGVVYSVVFWFIDLYFNPQFSATESRVPD